MIGMGNINGVEQRLGFYLNEGGVTKTIDDYDVLIERDGAIVKFPQKQNCLLNLTTCSWLSNTFDKASAFITAPIVALQTANDSRNNFGTLTTSEPSGGSLQVKKGSYLYLPNGGGNRISLNENILSGGSFTLAMTTRFLSNPTSSWRDIFLFQNTDGFRVEWNGSSFIPYSNNISSSQALPQITRTEWFQLVVVVNNTSLKIYQNGALVTNLTMSRNLDDTNGSTLSFYTQRGTGGVAGIGCNTNIRDLQVWKTALTDQEVADLRKFLYLD